MPETQFSLRSFPGNRAPAAPAGVEEAPVAGQVAPAAREANAASADRRDPTFEPLRRSGGTGSGAWEANRSDVSWPSPPVSDRATRDADLTWQPPPPAPVAPAHSEPATRSQPSTELVPPPLPEAPARPEEAPTPPAASPQASAPHALPPKPGRLNPWTVAAGIPVFLLVGYLVLLPVGFYVYRALQARQTDSVTLVADLGHGGVSQITVLFTTDDWLQVTAIDNDDPTRVTELAVTQVIALADSKVVVEAWLQAILVPGRLDLVMQLDSGQAFQPALTTVLINNVAAVKKDPHAPALRAPTASELHQARQKLGASG